MPVENSRVKYDRSMRFDRMDISNVIALLCGVSLFLFGMLLMGDGLKRVAGNKLELILYRLTNTPLKGVLLGTGVTTIIQSSSATSVMVVGFVNSGMMKVRQAIGIVLGAILGTSITGWIICLSSLEGSGTTWWIALLSTASLTGIIAVVGIILRMFCHSMLKHHLGDILLGFAILMTGMSAMSAAVSPLRDSALFLEALTSFKNPLIGILVGCLITCVLQSASATVGILQALSMTGAITFDIALPIIMGIAIGAAVPVLLSALGSSIAGKRVAFVYLIIDVLGVVILGPIFYLCDAIFDFAVMDQVMGMVGVSLINTVFRLLIVLMLTPAIPLLEKIVSLIFRENPEEAAEAAEMDRFETRFIQHPALALEQSNLAVCSMASKARANLMRALALLDNYTPDGYATIQAKEQVIDKYEDKLGTYLVALTRTELTREQSQAVFKILHTIGDFERIGDHAVNLSNTAKEINDKRLTLSADAQKEIAVLREAVVELLEITVEAFIQNDFALARKVEPLEQTIDGLCDQIKSRHILRVQTGDCALNHGFVFNDILTNYERIADHCSNVAVAMIELENGLFDTHEYLHHIKDDQEELFEREYALYSAKYTLESAATEEVEV